MKKLLAILAGVLLALGVAALAISLLSARPGVSMTLVEYKRFPHGAMLRLTNGTLTTIRYFAERNGLPAGSPVLSAEKTANGWSTTSSATIKSAAFLDPRTGKTIESFFLSEPIVLPKTVERIGSLLAHELRPGQSAEFFVLLDPGAAPKRVGTICLLPQSTFARKLQPWLVRIKQWCRMKTSLPGQVEVWCPESLYCPPLPPTASEK